MLRQHASGTTASTATEPQPLTSDEDVLRRYNSSWRDTAFGRTEHYRRCPKPSHRRCTSTPTGGGR
jgi:hypothetical protein